MVLKLREVAFASHWLLLCSVLAASSLTGVTRTFSTPTGLYMLNFTMVKRRPWGALLTVAILYYTWRIDLSPNGDSIKTATVFASLYWITVLVAYFFPGSLPLSRQGIVIWH